MRCCVQTCVCERACVFVRAHVCVCVCVCVRITWPRKKEKVYFPYTLKPRAQYDTIPAHTHACIHSLSTHTLFLSRTHRQLQNPHNSMKQSSKLPNGRYFPSWADCSRTESERNHWFWTFSGIFANYIHGTPCGIMVPHCHTKKRSRVCVRFHVHTWSMRACVLSHDSLPHTATHCNTLQRTATHVYTWTENCLFFCIYIQTFIHTRDMYIQTLRHILILQLVHYRICVTQKFVIYITHSLWHLWLI